MSETIGKGICRLAEIQAKSEVKERGREGGHLLVEIFSESEMSEGGRKDRDRLVELPTKNNVSDASWEEGRVARGVG